MSADEDKDKRIAELEDAVKIRDRRIEELRSEVDEQRELIRALEESTDDYTNSIESWCEAFGMEMTEDGAWTWKPFITEMIAKEIELNALKRDYNALVAQHNDLVNTWNIKHMGGRNVGRPLEASDAQCETVLKLRERGASLNDIAAETSLGVRTIRTILDKKNGADRTSRKYQAMWCRGIFKHHAERLAPEPDARRKAHKRKQRIRSINALPQRAQRVHGEMVELRKRVRGLGR